MKLSSRFLYLALIQAVGLGYTTAAKPAIAQSCPYESYIIIDGKCHQFSSIPKVKQPKIKTVLAEESMLDTYSYNPNAKTCSDFNYQDEAQDYHNKHSDSELDDDNDGIVCRYSLPLRKYGYLYKSSYQEVKNEYYRRKQARTFGFRDDIEMTIDEVQSIIGFRGMDLGNGTWVWGNILNPREEIKVKVLGNQVVKLSKKGF